MITVVVPLYNKGEYVAKTIDSILSQDLSNWECVIVDDGSTDNSADIVKSYSDKRIRYVYKKNGGVSSARNYGVSVANGSWILFLDADDTLSEKCLSDFENAIKRYEDSNLISANFYITNNYKKQIVGSSEIGYIKNPLKSLFLDKLYMRPGAFIIKKEMAELNPYSEKYSRYEDFEVQIRYCNSCHIAHFSCSVMNYVQEATEYSKRSSNPNKDFLGHLKLRQGNVWENMIILNCMYIALRNYSVIDNTSIRAYVKYLPAIFFIKILKALCQLI